jgi:fluoride exporter
MCVSIFEFLFDGVLVTLGAVAGTPARYFVSGVVARQVGETFPWGTLAVNVSGCLVMGLVAAYSSAHHLSGSSEFWLLLATGFCGSYTTVSSFSLQTLALVRDGERRPAASYIALSVVLCLAAVFAGFAVGVPLLAAAGRP